jgi:hypothetical protein
MARAGGEETPFDSDDRRRIAVFCRDRDRTLAEIGAKLGREEGSINGVVKRMVEAKLLVKGPARGAERRAKYSYRLAPGQIPALKRAERAARRARPKPEEAPAIRSGQRILLIGGAGLPEVAAELRRLSIDRHAEWAARVDGANSRILLAVPDDGPRCDEVEAAIRRIQGDAVQARIDRLLGPEAFAQWLEAGT